MQTKTSIAFLAVVLALAGCDGSPPADPDAGPSDTDSGMTGTPDAGTRDSGPAPAEGCDAARAITLTDGEQTITGNTTGMGTGVDLGDECAGEPTPQEILALTVPGTGTKTVTFDLAVGTTAFDTVVQVRPNSCESLTDAVCFDDVVYPDESRSAGHFIAEGGSTVHLIVTGYSFPDEPLEQGRWTMEIDVRDSAPAVTFTGGEAARIGGERYELSIDGGDADGDAIGVLFTLLDAAGEEIAYEGIAEIEWPFEESVEGQTTFEDAMIIVEHAGFLEATTAATQVRVAVYDRFGFTSEPMTLSIRNVTIVGRDEACNADALCGAGLECISETCQTPAATVAACEAATALTFTDDAVTATGSVEPGTSNLSGTCSATGTRGAENLYTITVPSGAYDLIASTEADATGDADTVVYVQTECGNDTTEAACNDDVASGTTRSRAIVQDAAGAYTIAVEIWGGAEAATAYQLDVRLRPVIGEGVTCDPMEIMNRCSTGACPSGDSPVCPAAPAPAP